MFLKIKHKFIKKSPTLSASNELNDNSIEDKKKSKKSKKLNKLQQNNNSIGNNSNSNNNIQSEDQLDNIVTTNIIHKSNSSDIESSDNLVENETFNNDNINIPLNNSLNNDQENSSNSGNNNSEIIKPSLSTSLQYQPQNNQNLNRNNSKSFLGFNINIKKKNLSKSTENISSLTTTTTTTTTTTSNKQHQQQINNRKSYQKDFSEEQNQQTKDDSIDNDCDDSPNNNQDSEEFEQDNSYEESTEVEDDEEDDEDYFNNLEDPNSYRSSQKNFNCLTPDQLVKQQEKEIKDIAELLSITTSSANSLLKHFNWKREELILKYFESPKEICKELGIEYNPINNLNNHLRDKELNNHNHNSSCNSNSNNGKESIYNNSNGKESIYNSNDNNNNNNNSNNIINSSPILNGISSNNNFINYYCTICGEESENSNGFTWIKCKHPFCNDCWVNYLTLKINEGEATIRCPFYKCKTVLEDQVIQRLTPPFLYEKYQIFTTKKFIQHNKQLRYCPTAGCDKAITLSTDLPTDSSRPDTVQCSCGFKFCFKCYRAGHSPASCEQMQLWEQKCQDESETSHWKVVNCKQCPKCNVSVEKNGGCMHMVCRQCQFEWCWECSKSWKGHLDFYVCNYNQNKDKEIIKRFLIFGGKNSKKTKESTEEEERRLNRLELERYLFYYERFTNHENSHKLEKLIRDEATKKMKELQISSTTWTEVQFIEKGIDQLLDCRNILKHTYIYAFFSFSDTANQRVLTAKELFEFLQEDLERTTEKLSELMSDVMKKSITLESSHRIEIMNYITLSKTKADGILNAVLKDSLFEF